MGRQRTSKADTAQSTSEHDQGDEGLATALHEERRSLTVGATGFGSCKEWERQGAGHASDGTIEFVEEDGPKQL